MPAEGEKRTDQKGHMRGGGKIPNRDRGKLGTQGNWVLRLPLQGKLSAWPFRANKSWRQAKQAKGGDWKLEGAGGQVKKDKESLPPWVHG